jgi:hypothetical protein
MKRCAGTVDVWADLCDRCAATSGDHLNPDSNTAAAAALRVIRPSMSKAELLLHCQWPWGKQVPAHHMSGSDAARYGIGFHALAAAWINDKKAPTPREIKKTAERFGLDETELGEHLHAAMPVLLDWLKGGNPWGVDLNLARARVELPLAYDVKRKASRVIAAPTEDTHEYEEAAPHEFPGTADLILDGMPDKYRSKKNPVPHFIVLDHKTGEFCDLPQESEQIKSLALAYDSIVKHEKGRLIAGAIFHAGRGGVPTVYTHEFDKKELEETRKRLLVAFSRIGDGSLTPGTHCAICPAMSICPAHTSALEKVGEAALSTMTAEKLGAQHQTVALIKKYLERWRQDAEAWVRTNGPGIRPDGQLLGIVEKDVERVSKKNVVEAEGAARAEVVFGDWRKKGYLKTETQEELRAVKE